MSYSDTIEPQIRAGDPPPPPAGDVVSLARRLVNSAWAALRAAWNSSQRPALARPGRKAGAAAKDPCGGGSGPKGGGGDDGEEAKHAAERLWQRNVGPLAATYAPRGRVDPFWLGLLTGTSVSFEQVDSGGPPCSFS